jgi:hypothetical protein
LTENSKLQNGIENIHSNIESPPIELFKFLRQEYNNQNPHKSGLVTLTASSTDYECGSSVVLDLDDQYWCSKEPDNDWMLFDLKGKRFKIQKIQIRIYYQRIPQHWQLLGSNNNSDWILLHDQGRDEIVAKASGQTVTDAIQSSNSFSYFKIQQLAQSYANNSMGFINVEFIGHLYLK